jgi:hypothetical protein
MVHRAMCMAAAAIVAAGVPVSQHLLSAQQLKCYHEVCVETSDGTQSCVERPVPCPDPT